MQSDLLLARQRQPLMDPGLAGSQVSDHRWRRGGGAPASKDEASFLHGSEANIDQSGTT